MEREISCHSRPISLSPYNEHASILNRMRSSFEIDKSPDRATFTHYIAVDHPVDFKCIYLADMVRLGRLSDLLRYKNCVAVAYKVRILFTFQYRSCQLLGRCTYTLESCLRDFAYVTKPLNTCLKL